MSRAVTLIVALVALLGLPSTASAAWFTSGTGPGAAKGGMPDEPAQPETVE